MAENRIGEPRTCRGQDVNNDNLDRMVSLRSLGDMNLTTCNGQPFEIPLFDPVVAAHFHSPSSLVDTLMDEIGTRERYAEFFKGKKDLTFVDIGANIGLVSLYAAPACSRIIAVEPAPETFKVLKAMTHKFPQIECVNAALLDRDGTHEFFLNNENSTASSAVNPFGDCIEVQGMTLTSLLSIYQLEHVDVCKADIEGAEGDALSLPQLSAAKRTVDTFFIETHNCPKSSWEVKMTALVAILSALGYENQKIEGMALICSK